MTGRIRRFSNAILKRLLRSPLHGIVSRTTLLITVTGRKSGIAYTTPVDYLQRGSSIAIFSSKDHRWWRNIGDGAPVHLTLRGREVDGYATVERPTPDVVAREMRELYPRMSAAQAIALAPQTLIIRVQLNTPA